MTHSLAQFKRVVAAFVALCISASSTLTVCLSTASSVASLPSIVATSALFYSASSVAQMTTQDAATLGNAISGQAKSMMLPPTSSTSNNTVTINSTHPGVNSTTLTIDQLVGAGSNTSSNASLISNTTAAYGSMPNLTAASTAQTSTLMDPANSSSWSSAYKTIRGSASTNNLMTVDMRNDPAVSQAQAVGAGTDPNQFISTTGSSCITTNVNTTTTQTVFMSDPRSCDRYVGPPGCVVTRLTQGSSVSYSNVLSFSGQVGTGTTIAVSMKTPTGNSYATSGNTTTLNSAIPSQGIPFSISDSFGAPTNVYNLVAAPLSDLQWTSINTPLTASYSISGQDPLTVVTVTPPSEVNSYTLTISIANPSPILSNISIDVSLAQSPLSHVAVQDFPPGCAASVNCTAQPISWTSSGVGLDLASNDTWACNEAFAVYPGDPVLPDLFPGEPMASSSVPVCYKATARNVFCTAPLETSTTTCAHLESNPACHLDSTTCLPINKDPITGVCLYQTEKWECGVDATVTVPSVTPQTTCGGPIQCLGSNCVTEPPKESNPDFAAAAAALSATQFMNNDKDCSSGVCVVFKGDGYSCKIVFWGVQNCCDKPSGVNLADYVKLMSATYSQIDRKEAIAKLDSLGLDVSGSMEALSNWTSSTYSSISDPIISSWQSLTSRGSTLVTDTVTGTTSGAAADLSMPSLSGMQQLMQNQLAAWTEDIFGQSAAKALFGANYGAAADFSTSAIGGPVSTIFAVFAYYQIAMLIIQIVWACDNSEMELAVRKDMRMCHELGDYCTAKFLGVCYERKKAYCCFKSPLARIMQEQIRAVSGIPWPEASSAPSCPGLTIDQIANADFSRVDLSEWVAILQSSNVMPSAANASSTLNVSGLTTLHNPTGTSGNDALTNAKIATQGTDARSSNQFVKNQLWATLP